MLATRALIVPSKKAFNLRNSITSIIPIKTESRPSRTRQLSILQLIRSLSTLQSTVVVETEVVEKETILSRKLGSSQSVPVSEFNTVLGALAQSNLPDAALRSERWLRYLEVHGTPDECSYLNVLTAWKNAVHEDPSRVVARAEQWFDKCKHNKSTKVYNVYLDILTSGRSLKNGRDRNSRIIRQLAEKAERILKNMIQQNLADIDSFNFAIRGWNRCRHDIEVAERCIHILRLMERHNYSPDFRTYGFIMDAIANRAKLRIRRCRDPRGPDNGLEEFHLLKNILKSYVQPRTYDHNILLSCLANLAPLHAKAPMEAESVLSKLIAQAEATGVGPDTISYNMVMRCWANSGQPNRGDRILYWLQTMWRDYDYSGINMPNVQTYNTAMRAWISLKRPHKAEELLQDLIQHSQRRLIVPDSESFSFTIRAWLQVAMDGSEFALQSAGRWMKELLEAETCESSSLKFSIDLFSLYLAAARKCAPHAPWIVQDVNEMFRRVRESRHQIDCLHYARWLQVGLLAYSKPESDDLRNEFIQTAITEAKYHGLVSAHLVQTLGNGPVYQTGWTVKESDRVFLLHFPYWPMPNTWMRNVNRDPPTKDDMQRTNFQTFRHGHDPCKERN